MINDCTLLLSSYDGGEDLWDGFFTALKKQWPEMDLPIVINTESKQYCFKGYDIKCLGVCGKKSIPWAKRLKDVLRRIDTEYILLFLEDYWLDKPVDDSYFRESLKWLRDNKDIATFSYYPCVPERNIQDNMFDRMELRPEKCEYKLNCQVAIWRRKDLISFLRNHEDPWEWEIWGSMRASRYKQRFYTLKPGAKPVFSYGNPEVGCLIHRGKWVEEVAKSLNDMYNLNIDFSIRGFENFEEYYAEPKPFWQRVLEEGLSNKIQKRVRMTIRKFMSLR